LLLGAGLVGGLGNLVFNLLVARGGGAVSYGAVGSLLMLATVAGFFATGCQYAVAHLAAVAPPGASRLLRAAFRGVAPWLILSVGLLAAAVPLSSYLHLGSLGPVLLTAALLGATVLGAAPTGLLVGASRFRAVALIAVMATVFRLILGVFLGHGPGTIVGALTASLIPVVLAAVVGIVVLRLPRRRQPVASEDAHAPSAPGKTEAGVMARGALGAVIAGALWGIWTLPVLAARHQLRLEEAGAFAAAQLLAGGILYATAPLVTAFYPTLARGRDRQAVVVGLLATAGIAGVGVLGLGLLGPILMPRLYGPEFHPSSTLLFVLGFSALVTTVAGFASWAAVARSRVVRPVVVGLSVGLVSAGLLCALWAHSALELGSVPALALLVGGLAASVSQLVMAGESFRAEDPVRSGETVRL
jgi:O-antigen/teichoic acid export membrane protein